MVEISFLVTFILRKLHTRKILPAAIDGGIHLETKLYSSAFSHTCSQISKIFLPKLSLEQNL